jgi:sulfur carrier protein
MTAMIIICNGETREVAGRGLSEILRELGYVDAAIATAVNGEFVPARQRDAITLNAGDALEVLAPRQGG